MLLKAAPIALVLFLFFPRLAGSFWGAPSAERALSGLTEEMSPGDISDLTLNDVVAFRVRFDGNSADPAAALLARARAVRIRRLHLVARRCTVLLPAGRDPSRPARSTTRSRSSRRASRCSLRSTWSRAGRRVSPSQSWDFGLRTRNPVNAVLRYDARSHPRYRAGNDLSAALRNRSLQLPRGRNPRAAEFARSLRASAGSDAAYVQAVLDLFRKQDFYYTLTPPGLERDSVDDFLFNTRQGFCGHFASAFTMLMRARRHTGARRRRLPGRRLEPDRRLPDRAAVACACLVGDLARGFRLDARRSDGRDRAGTDRARHRGGISRAPSCCPAGSCAIRNSGGRRECSGTTSMRAGTTGSSVRPRDAGRAAARSRIRRSGLARLRPRPRRRPRTRHRAAVLLARLGVPAATRRIPPSGLTGDSSRDSSAAASSEPSAKRRAISRFASDGCVPTSESRRSRLRRPTCGCATCRNLRPATFGCCATWSPASARDGGMGNRVRDRSRRARMDRGRAAGRSAPAPGVGRAFAHGRRAPRARGLAALRARPAGGVARPARAVDRDLHRREAVLRQRRSRGHARNEGRDRRAGLPAGARPEHARLRPPSFGAHLSIAVRGARRMARRGRRSHRGNARARGRILGRQPRDPVLGGRGQPRCAGRSLQRRHPRVRALPGPRIGRRTVDRRLRRETALVPAAGRGTGTPARPGGCRRAQFPRSLRAPRTAANSSRSRARLSSRSQPSSRATCLRSTAPSPRSFGWTPPPGDA